MKMSNEEMKTARIIAGFCTVVLLCGCEVERNMPVSGLDSASRLVVYCMPSAQRDTTVIQVTHSLPINGNYGPSADASVAVEDCDIDYQVNGHRLPVRATSIFAPVGTVPPGHYYVVHSHRPGDRVSLSVSHEGYPPVAAATTVPDTTRLGPISMREVSRLDEDGNIMRYYQLTADIAPAAGETGCYAVSVEQLLTRSYFTADDVLTTDSASAAIDISMLDEPLLSPLTDVDEEVDFDDYRYGHLYCFDGRQLMGRESYTLHLNVVQTGHSGTLRIALYQLTPDYYRFVNSINDALNNGMAETGLSAITPTFTNVAGGLGVVGAFAVSTTQWITVDPWARDVWY